MNKEIEKLQVKLNEAKSERVRSEVRYNSHVVIMEGCRNTLRELENISQNLISKLTDSESVVGEFNNQLKKAIEDEGIKNEMAKNEEVKQNGNS